ncbi:GH25 family lysozyme [Streptomyces misionensis]|uniref:GH25 family lysozyme n=1 Tax=Streptomyces misionensis TaxID=67331 RepID=UPI003403AFF1
MKWRLREGGDAAAHLPQSSHWTSTRSPFAGDRNLALSSSGYAGRRDGEAAGVVKRTEGKGYTNPRASAQVAHGRKADLVIGHYHYPHIHDGAAADADYFLGRLGADLRPGDVLALDWEWYGQNGVSNAEADTFKDQWLARVRQKAPGHRIITYADRSNWLTVDQNSNVGDGLWIADYVTAGKPRIKAKWLFHQFSSTPVDQDVANFADPAALRAWANPAAPAPKPTPAYEPFPGASWFTIGRKSPIVAAMHDRLVAVGCNRYKSSANKDVIGSGDVASYEAWQRKCGYSGAAASWPPGPTTWAKLHVPNV